MRFENSFSVAAPPDEVFQTLLDLEKVAPAMPGATVSDKEGDKYKVAIKVKLGPMTMNYRGDVEIRDKNPEAHSAVMHVKAREARGQGNATADVTTSVVPENGGSRATIVAEVQLAGKAAAMGRGLIEDVSGKLVNEFANNLSEMLGGGNGAVAEADKEAESGGAEAEAETPVAEPPRAAEPRAAGPTEPPAAGEPDAFDVGGVATAVAKDKARDPRTLAVAALGVLAIVFLVRRRSR